MSKETRQALRERETAEFEQRRAEAQQKLDEQAAEIADKSPTELRAMAISHLVQSEYRNNIHSANVEVSRAIALSNLAILGFAMEQAEQAASTQEA